LAWRNWGWGITAHVATVAFQGIDAVPVDVQAQFRAGQVNFHSAGLADKAISQSQERLRAALHAIGLGLPDKRPVVNLAPADLPKIGSHYDLPIALAIRSARGVIAPDFLAPYLVMGELALDGGLLRMSGALPAAMSAKALDLGLIGPKASGREAAWAGEKVDKLAPENLIQLINHLKGTPGLSRPSPHLSILEQPLPDLGEIKGQDAAERALDVAAAGGHHPLMVGPSRAGKSVLAHRLPSILPPLHAREMLDVSMIA
jgi:magnesium chelatase family protein